MPLDDALGCLAEGCFEILFQGILEFMFPTFGRKRRAKKRGEAVRPVPLWARFVSLAIWAIVLTTIVAVVWMVLFWGR